MGYLVLQLEKFPRGGQGEVSEAATPSSGIVIHTVLQCMYVCKCMKLFAVPPYTAEYVSTLNREIISVVKALRKLDDITQKNSLSRIVALINKDILSREKFVEVSPLFVSLFLRHRGVFYLCQALEMNRSSQFTDQAIM